MTDNYYTKSIQMFCGNSKAKNILEQYLKESGQFSFLLVSGPSQLGKSTLVQKLVEEQLGSTINQDFLHIKDLSSELNKRHTIKVENNEYISGKDGEYHDKGSRQMTDRLSTSSLGGQKILLIENIERMTIGAANALLKSLEEPLPGRKIVATTSQPDKILQTIRSRAIVVRFQSVTDLEIQNRVSSLGLDTTSNHEQLLFFAAGKPGRIFDLMHDQPKAEQLTMLFSDLQRYYEKGDTTRLYKLLQQIDKEGLLGVISEAWMSRLSSKNHFAAVEKINKTLRMSEANVQKDSLLFSLSLPY